LRLLRLTQAKRIFIILAIVVLVLPLFACAKSEVSSTDGTNDYKIDLNSSKIGVTVGTVHDQILKEVAPNAQVEYFETTSDEAVALETGKIDTYANFESGFAPIKAEHPNFVIADAGIEKQYDSAFALPKGASDKDVYQKLNQYIVDISSDGTLQEIIDGWNNDINYHDIKEEVDALTGENGTLRLGVNTAEGAPYDYMYYGFPSGIDIDVIAHFCEEYGYKLEVTDLNFSGLLSSLAAGKIDLACSNILVTDERKENMDFTVPHLHDRLVFIVNAKDSVVSDAGLFERLADSFEKTFIREDRWKLFVDGLRVTLKISLMSIILGTIIGFLIYIPSRIAGQWLTDIIFGISWVVCGIPVVVLLMILYYAIFGGIDITGTWVAIICFTMVFAASEYYALYSTAAAVEKGQYEAARALGYDDGNSFVKVVFPQMMPVFFTYYAENVGVVLKGTAVVGYIAVMDITKVSDIIRARTFDAFFPLIASALIYLLLQVIIMYVIRAIKNRLDPKNRKQIKLLEGVNVHD